ncbi:MAG: hypothetical protein JWR69_4751 [Pedosphaera sp.]|nr:hypothetical protein [Pedosphaera sp.]
MKLSEFKQLLARQADRNIRFVLPTGTKIPPQAHVTEVARIEKRFIDCGGTFRTEFMCRLQTWFSDDTNHRLTAGKLLGILQKSAAFLETENMEVDVEYEAPFISQFPVTSVATDGGVLEIHLGTKHTACLAEDKCLPPSLVTKAAFLNPIPELAPAKCCS